MTASLIQTAVLIPLANHAPDHLGAAILLYFGPVLALVAFLVFIARRGRGGEAADPEGERQEGQVRDGPEHSEGSGSKTEAER